MKKKIHDQPKPAKQNPTRTPNHDAPFPSQTSFSDHIAELRRRIFLILFAFLAASALAYNYRDALLGLIMSPLGSEKLIYLTPGGGFNFIFQIALYAGLLAAAPVLIYQLYGFIRPALPKKAQRSSIIVVLVAFLLMACGVTFGYFIAVPSALQFLSHFAGSSITPSLTADSYLSFFLAYIAGLGVLFELPLLLLFLHWVHPMTPGSLLKSERFVILFAFVASAIITPTPDVLNQSMIAVPLIAIYQLGAIVVLITIYRDRRGRREEVTTNTRTLVPVPRTAQVTPVGAKISPIAAELPTPLAPTKPMTIQRPLAVKRSIDGFTASSRPALLRPQVPARPAVQSTIPPRRSPQQYRRSFNMDGFF